MSWRSRAALILVAASFAACAHNPKPDDKPSPLTLPARVGAAPPGSATSSTASNANPFALDQFDLQRMFKRLTDLSFMTQLGSEMIVRKVTYSGADKLPIPAYFFAPKDTTRKRAALIFVHDGIHGDLSDTYVPHIRSLVREGYVIVAPEYRGSTGYGKDFYDAIDYGGKEVDDVLLAREFLRDVVPYADLGKLGIIGWSHGGFITLHSIFRHPEFFRVAVAHVPVADLPARMRTHNDSYQKLFSDQPAYGGTYAQNPRMYIARSPDAHARELKIPLLVHAASNDDDVFIVENRNLRDSMVAAGKDRAGLYRYREFTDPPGGHGFNRIQTREGLESWNETLVFLRKYLHPERAPKVK